MAQLYRATAKIRTDSTDPEDEVNNVWHFLWNGAGDAGSAARAQLADSLASFYQDIMGRMSGTIKSDVGAHEIALSKVLNWDVPGVGNDTQTSPISVHPFSLTGVAASFLPHELAIVLSSNGDLTGVFENFGATRPRQRRRGRIYIGPMASAELQLQEAGSKVCWNTATCNAIAAAALEHLAPSGAVEPDNLATTDWRWVVYSRAEGAAYPVVNCHVDDAVDVQRRRGQASFYRKTQVIV